MHTLRKKAHAKINLTLEILGTARDDGFHDIASVMHKVPNLYDELTVSVHDASSVISLVCDKAVCAEKDNLAYRAAEKYLAVFAEKTGKQVGCDILLKKNIPAGAGLAGGSTDAAAVLDALRTLIGTLTEDEIDKIALSLGSDVPFCLEKHTAALCTGRGEIMTELPPMENVEIAFIFPETPLSTKGIYGEYDRLYGDDYTKSNSTRLAECLQKRMPLDAWKHLLCNDFMALCEERCPEIRISCEKLAADGYVSQMSGSGSAVFGLKSQQ